MLTEAFIPEIRTTLAALCAATGESPPCLTDDQVLSMLGTRAKSPRDHAAHKELLVATLDRMARRVGHDVRQAAKQSDKLCAWIDGGAKEHKVAFDEALRPVLKAYASIFGGDVGELCAKAEGEFFDGLLVELNELTQPPNKASDLQANVDKAMNYFERFAGERVANVILGAT